MIQDQNSPASQESVIPIMPCPDIQVQVAFYKVLGFDVSGLYTSPNPYASLKWKSVEIHFYGSRKLIASENPTMCYLVVEDVDEVNQAFTAALKKYYGKVPRTGFPKITKVRNLADDRRFTLTDPGGNTLFIGSKSTEEDRFFRKLDDEEYAKMFAVLYDVLYSKEDPKLAESMLSKYAAMRENLQGLDKAKFLLTEVDIQKHLGHKAENASLEALIKANKESTGDWKRISKRYFGIINEEE